MKVLIILSLLFCLPSFALEFAGIASASYRAPSASVEKPAHIKALYRMEQRKDSVTSVKATCNIEVNAGGTKTNLNGSLIGLPNGNTRVQISWSAWGIIDFGIQGTDVNMFFIRKDVNFSGSTTDVKRLGCSEARVFETNISGLKLFFPDTWEEDTEGRSYVKESDKEYLLVFKKSGSETKYLRKVFLEKKGEEYYVSKVVMYDQNQTVCGVALYENYMEKSGHMIPTKVTLKFSSKVSFTFSLNDVTFNKAIDPSSFAPKISEEAQKRNFEDLQEIGFEKMLKE